MKEQYAEMPIYSGLAMLKAIAVIDFVSKLARQSPRPQGRGGKSGLRRAGCRL